MKVDPIVLCLLLLAATCAVVQTGKLVRAELELVECETVRVRAAYAEAGRLGLIDDVDRTGGER